MVFDSKTKTMTDVLYPNNSKVGYPLPNIRMLDALSTVCVAPNPQQNSFIVSGGFSSP